MNTDLVVLILLVQAVSSAILGAIIANDKQAGCLGAFAGLFLGPFGVLVACLVDRRPRCPRCCEHIAPKARICIHCREKLGWRTDRWPIPVEPSSAEAGDLQQHGAQPIGPQEFEGKVVEEFLQPSP